jgi:hypothetical protein
VIYPHYYSQKKFLVESAMKFFILFIKQIRPKEIFCNSQGRGKREGTSTKGKL